MLLKDKVVVSDTLITWKVPNWKQIDECLFLFLAQMAFLQDTYPKGVIPLGAIQMARAAKDNKFEIVTNQRTFVFRADNEGKHVIL